MTGPVPTLTHVEVAADLTADRVRVSITRADSPARLDLLMTGAEARHVAQQLIRAGGQVAP